MSTEAQLNNNDARKLLRLQGKNFFVTWPKCNATKEDVLARAQEFFADNLEFAVVSKEDHADGTPHLHALFALKKRKDYRNAASFDVMANSHGNYQVARSQRDSVKYVTKHGDFTAVGVDVEAYLEAAKKKTSTKMTIAAKMTMEGSTLLDLNDWDPGFVMMHLKKLKDYQTQTAVWRDTPTQAWNGLRVTPLSLPPALVRVAAWLDKNMGRPRTLRQKQLLLSSPPGMGKTTLVETLRRYFKVYDQMGDKWFDGFDPLEHQLIVFDEFCGGIPLSIINKVLDGQRCTLQTKGGSLQKTRNIPVIILTNFLKEELYIGEKVSHAVREAFLDRCSYVRLEKGAEAWRLLPCFATEMVVVDDEFSSEEEEDEPPDTSNFLTFDSQGMLAPNDVNYQHGYCQNLFGEEY